MSSTPVTNATGTESKRLNQHFMALLASFSGFAVGVSLAWNSLAVEIFRKNLDASATEIGLVGAILNAGASLGALMVPLGIRCMKHSHLMTLILLIHFIGWIFICLSGSKVLLLIIGRAVCGFSIGAICILTPTFIAEIADKEKRERILTYFQLLNNCGVMYAFLVAHSISLPKTVWRYSLLCFAPCYTIEIVRSLPESPLHYLARNNKDKAMESLMIYRGSNKKIDDEFAELERLVNTIRSRKITWQLVKNWPVIKACLSCLLVVLIQQLCGANAMMLYARSLFELAGSGSLSGSELTLVVGAVQILSCLLAGILLCVVSRRVLLAVSCSLMGLFLISLGWFFHLRQLDPEYDDIYYWMPPTWINLFFAAYNIGVGPISWSVLGDILPLEMRMLTAASIVSLCYLITFVVNLHFVQIVMALGVPKLICLNAGFCWIAGVCCIFISVDYKGRSLAEIQETFHADTNQSNPTVEI